MGGGWELPDRFILRMVKPERSIEISPCHQVKLGVPPTLVLHGTDGRTVPFENTERFTAEMKKVGNPCRLISFEGLDHGFFNSIFFRPKLKSMDVYDKAMSDSVSFLESLVYLD